MLCYAADRSIDHSIAAAATLSRLLSHHCCCCAAVALTQCLLGRVACWRSFDQFSALLSQLNFSFYFFAFFVFVSPHICGHLGWTSLCCNMLYAQYCLFGHMLFSYNFRFFSGLYWQLTCATFRNTVKLLLWHMLICRKVGMIMLSETS